MAGAAGRDLAHGESEMGEAAGVVIGLDVAREHGDAALRAEAFERALQQRSLAGAGRADEVQAEHTVAFEPLAQGGGDAVVFVENLALERNAHQGSSSSRYVNSI